MTRDELNRLGYIEQPDGSFSRVPIRALEPDKRGEQSGSLVETPQQGHGSKGKVAGSTTKKRRVGWAKKPPVIQVMLISLRSRPLDDDNLTGGFKPLRDAIANDLGVDDGDGSIDWECRQVKSEVHGTVVMITKIEEHQ